MLIWLPRTEVISTSALLFTLNWNSCEKLRPKWTTPSVWPLFAATIASLKLENATWWNQWIQSFRKWMFWLDYDRSGVIIKVFENSLYLCDCFVGQRAQIAATDHRVIAMINRFITATVTVTAQFLIDDG